MQQSKKSDSTLDRYLMENNFIVKASNKEVEEREKRKVVSKVEVGRSIIPGMSFAPQNIMDFFHLSIVG